MTSENWADPMARSVALFIDGATDPDVGADGTPLVDDDFLVFVNAMVGALEVPCTARHFGWPLGNRLRHFRS